ncbi:MAG: hypothetical protein KDE31_35385, partial [Caldilineaceae bacterium]|nr:hypothetical protein [Caldilineaceae bacterium]
PPTPTPTTIPLAPTVPITDVVSARLVAAGGAHTCAVIRGGAWCWGQNDFYGQLGDGGFAMQNKPVQVQGLASGVKSIAAGVVHTGALMTSGAVKCWGNNYWYALGISTLDHSYSPTAVDVLGIEDAIDIAVGNHQSCVLLADRTVKCWGWNAFGKLGIGSTDDSVATPTHVIDGATQRSLENVQAIAVSFNHHMCALVQGGLKCWGGNAPLGTGSAISSTVPVDILPPGSGIVALDTGEKETCFVKRDNSVWCWGSKDNSVFTSTTPALINTLPLSTTKITVGNNFACALLVDGSIRCWGGVQADGENYGYLGTATTGTSRAPIEIPGIGRDIADISAGSRHACAMAANGEIRCWGYNQFGQLGDGVRPAHPLPQPLAVTRTTGPIVALAPGGHHNCLLTTGGIVRCWGANQYGQTGTGTTSLVVTNSLPVNLPMPAIAIGSGYHHSCAVTTDGAVWCWGRNQYGQLGNGNDSDSTSPVRVVALDGPAVELTVGRDHACVRLAAG